MAERRVYRLLVLLAGLTGVALAVLQWYHIQAFKAELTEISGALRSADIYVSTEIDSTAEVAEGEDQPETHKPVLIFLISGQEQSYALGRTGREYSREELQSILQSLRQADKVSVWVRKKELVTASPEVSGIAADNTILMDAGIKQTTKKIQAVFFFLSGMTCLVWVFFRKKS